MYKIMRSLAYGGALLAILAGCITAVLKNDSLSEYFGVITFVLLAVGIIIDFITEVIKSTD